MLGTAGHRGDAGTGQSGQEALPGHTAEDIVVGESRRGDAAPGEPGSQVADDGLDFGQLGHGFHEAGGSAAIGEAAPGRLGRLYTAPHLSAAQRAR